jgi:sporulation integral membrane protein YtvI
LRPKHLHFFGGLNDYIQKGYEQVQGIINGLELENTQIPEQVYNIIQNSLSDFIGVISSWLQNLLTSVLNGITKIPIIGTYVVITILATYFICTDKLYILDQLEHHLPKVWIKKLRIHLKEITTSLGAYLKAEAILVLISFVEVLVGLYIFKFMGLNVPFPLLAALAIGFVDALPILGSGTVMVPWAIASSINGDINLALGLIILYVIILVVRQLVEPRIVSKQIGIHPIFTLISMYTGFKFLGIMGLLLGPIFLIILKNIFGTVIDRGVVKTILDRK